MEFFDVVRSRRSIRHYLDKPVARETVNRILEAGRLAPSWCNRQCWRYIVVSDPKKRAAIGELNKNPNEQCFNDAPYTIVLVADPSDSGHNNSKQYYLVDCGVSMEHVILAATAEGLGTCWVGVFNEYGIKNILGIPKEKSVVAMTPLGYPAKVPEQRERFDFNYIVYEEQWQH